MIPVHKIHHKFRDIWPEYQNRDLVKIGKWLINELGIKLKGDAVEQVKRHWGNVCNYLIQWERNDS